MKLLTKKIQKQLPPLRSQEEVEDPVVQVKFFCPWNQWTWYGIEYSEEEDRFFGYVEGLDKELGSFSLAELAEIVGPGGLGIERDKFFRPCPLSEVKAGGC
jgi:hypothetical protein